MYNQDGYMHLPTVAHNAMYTIAGMLIMLHINKACTFAGMLIRLHIYRACTFAEKLIRLHNHTAAFGCASQYYM